MLSRISARTIVLLAVTGLLVFGGCSSDDPAAPGGGTTTGDVTPPLVVSLVPDNLANGVNISQSIEVNFSEPMDQGTFAAALNLSSGTVTDVVWNPEGTAVVVSHSDWAEGVTVTVTVGTGVTDLAGNALPQNFSSEFYTFASTPVMVGYDFFAPMDDVPLSGFFEISFSRSMDRNSILNAYSLTIDPPLVKDLPGVIVDTVDGDNSRIRFTWDSPLAPNQTYHFGISTAAQTLSGDNLSAPIAIDFTTGTALDETPPYIVSTTPALDSVVDPDVGTITITFSERIDQTRVTPSEMSGLLQMFTARDPVWNEAGDEMTVYLAGPLPHGIRFYAIWGAGDLHDMAGLGNASPDSLSFSISGAADLYPVREDLRIYYEENVAKIEPGVLRQTFENLSGNDFERVVNRQTETGFDDQQERWYMSKDGLNTILRGFQEGQQAMMFNPPVTYLPSPLPASWSGSTTVSASEGTIALNFTGTFVETFRDQVFERKANFSNMYLDNCVEVTIYHEMIPTGSTSVMEDGTDTVYLCPGLGIIAMDSVGHAYDGGVVVDTWTDSYELLGAALDGRYEDNF